MLITMGSFDESGNSSALKKGMEWIPVHNKNLNVIDHQLVRTSAISRLILSISERRIREQGEKAE